jgi:hypothetical protein
MSARRGGRHNAMKRFFQVGALALVAVTAAACDESTNPIEEFGQLGDPYVRFEFPDDIGVPGTTIPVVFVMTTRVEEDVTINFTLAGNAVYGTDYWAVDRAGVRRTDVTQAGGVARITYRPTQTTFARDTLRIFVPAAARDGRKATIEIASATTASGRTISTGFIDEYRTYELSIEGFVDIQTGTYTGQRTSSDVGNANVTVTVAKPATPFTTNGVSYAFTISDFTGAADLFGVPVPWAFNVTSGGTVVAAPRSTISANVTSAIEGTYNFTTRTLTLNIELTCCGGEGLTWQLRVARP